MTAYLVDARVWAEYLRGESPALRILVDRLLDENRAAVSGAVLADLLAGIGSDRDRRLLGECFLGLPFLETTRETFLLAGSLGAALRRRGTAAPLGDLLTAALAKSRSLKILALDDRFAPLARQLGLEIEILKGDGPASQKRATRTKSKPGG